LFLTIISEQLLIGAQFGAIHSSVSIIGLD